MVKRKNREQLKAHFATAVSAGAGAALAPLAVKLCTSRAMKEIFFGCVAPTAVLVGGALVGGAVMVASLQMAARIAADSPASPT